MAPSLDLFLLSYLFSVCVGVGVGVCSILVLSFLFLIILFRKLGIIFEKLERLQDVNNVQRDFILSCPRQVELGANHLNSSGSQTLGCIKNTEAKACCGDAGSPISRSRSRIARYPKGKHLCLVLSRLSTWFSFFCYFPLISHCLSVPQCF